MNPRSAAVSASPHAERAGAEPLERKASARRRRVPLWALVASCGGLGLISVLVLSWVPGSDPWAWIDWGQEIASSKISLSLAHGPSWKPFPVFFTAIFGLFGGTAPHLWLLISRTAGFLALLGAYRVARRFGGVSAGVLAALALLLTQDALFYFARGASEPIVAALTLWAVDRHLSGQPRVAYLLTFLAAMNRPEFLPFLALYGLYLWLRVSGTRALVVAGLILYPIAWFGAPGVISGNFFQAGNAALGGKGSPGTGLAELSSGFTLMTVPTVVLGFVGLALAYLRRHLVLLCLGAGAIAWAVMEAIITQVAYGLPRYLLPAAAIACVLAGVAIVWLAEEVAGRVPQTRSGGARERLAGAALVAVALIALTLPWTLPRGRQLVRQADNADQAAVYVNGLFAAADRAGGKRRVLPCRSSVVAVNHTMASALAWKLQVPERRTLGELRGTGFVFSAPHTVNTGTTPPIRRRSTRTVRVVVDLPPWRVLEVTRIGASAAPRCAARRRAPA